MRKAGFMAMAAAFLGMASAAQDAEKEFENFNGNPNQPRFFPSKGNSPKQYGMYIANRQSNIIKRKRRSKLAFG